MRTEKNASERAFARRAAQALSFCLPGLGHLYAGARGRALALNGSFLLLLSNASTRLLVPVVAIFSAWEAGRLAPDFAVTRTVPGRWGLFATAGGVGVFLWSVVVFGELSPWKSVERSREAVNRAAKECRKETGFDPLCVTKFTDGWGRRLEAMPGDGAPRSLGRDGQLGTLDDVGLPFASPISVAPGAFDRPDPTQK